MMDLIQHAQVMLSELESQFLEVVLLDAPEPNFDGHKIRVAVNKNPQWYSDYYYSRHATPQKKEFMKALRDISNGIFRDLTYYNEIIDMILNKIENENSETFKTYYKLQTD